MQSPGSRLFPMRNRLLLVLIFISACAPKVVLPPVITAPRFPEFVQPAVAPAAAGTPAAINEARGWAWLQSGDLKAAEREFDAALRNTPGFLPAEISLGYVELARKDARAALPHFERALGQAHDELSAIIGRAQTLLALDRGPDALAAFEAALAVDPNQPDIRRRVEVMQFRVAEGDIARARQAARSGRLDESVQVYAAAIASSPDSPFLYRELAAVERQQGDADGALAHFRRAVELDPTDARSLAQIGEILDARGDVDGAAKAYADALALEPSVDVGRKLDDLRARAALARLPAEYHAIGQAAQVTRADLAALIGIHLSPLLQRPQSTDAALITDVRSHWAATWIVAVARAGVMEPFANHAFQPRTLVRRSELAQVTARLLSRLPGRQADLGKWEAARLKFTDLAVSHLAYPAASIAVASGVMTAGPDNAFQPSRAVTGAEAVDAVAKIEALAGLTEPK
jgi:tetratricopeptide (TPR) repeat protein